MDWFFFVALVFQSTLPLDKYCVLPLTHPSVSVHSSFVFITPILLPPSILRWIWRWPCLVKGRIRRSRCLCSGCLWSVYRCCWKPCQVTSTRSPRTLFRLWTSSHGICLPWGTVTHPSLLLHRCITYIFTCVDRVICGHVLSPFLPDRIISCPTIDVSLYGSSQIHFQRMDSFAAAFLTVTLNHWTIGLNMHELYLIL